MANINLSNFKIEELQIILGHLKLGKEHLKKQLPPEQFKELENYGFAAKREENEWKVDKTEKLSHVAIILNSIITGIFGVWMGLAAVLDIDVNSKLEYVSGASLICGGLMGIAILILNKKESQNALSSQKLQNFESQIFETIYQKQKEKLVELIEVLKKKYEEICHKAPEKIPASFEKKEDFASWFYLFHQGIHLRLNEFPKEKIFQYYRDEVLQILKKTEDSFIEKGELVGDFATALNKENMPTSDPEKTYHSAVEILINPSLSIPTKQKNKKTLWCKQEIFGLLFALFPFMLGAFGSILMWCNSTSLLPKIFNLEAFWDSSQCSPYVKVVIAIFFTLNFTFFYYYSQKKSFQRKQNFELKTQGLLNQEAKVVQMTQRLNLVLFLDSRIEEMIKFLESSNIFKIVFKNEEHVPKAITSEVIEGAK